ncbi:MAG: aminotransferase class V-fold PLP-dependent enzyme [Eubacteriales bacterium]|nr:aminotransferase class V-fold PLP-dependent enzyme [Eubacteriales bacterium]
MQISTSIYDFITNYLEKDTVSFHMPGHKGSKFYQRFGYHDFLDRIMEFDITEIPGADNLFQAESVIKGVQEQYAKLYGCKRSYIVINGTSGGNIAAILASVNKGKQLLMARNNHKSVFNALSLGGIRPVYVYPEMIEEYGLSGSISPLEIERLIIENPDVQAIMLTSPNYYGVCSDIETIADIAHKYKKVLIIDEAHGAHLHFSEFLPPSAIRSGADIVINSTHKTLGSFTQSAALHYNSELVDPYVLEDKLQCIQSTSPSYVLMTSMEITAKILEQHGQLLMNEWLNNLNTFFDRIKGISGLRTTGKMEGLDWTKINLTMGELGITGSALDNILIDDYNIYTELFTGDWVMALSGIGNTKDDFDRLADALEDISRKAIASGTKIQRTEKKGAALTPPRQAVLFEIPVKLKRVKLEDSEGMICGKSIIPYPPGIPLISPGERIDADAIAYIKTLRELGERVIGISESGEVIVGE